MTSQEFHDETERVAAQAERRWLNLSMGVHLVVALAAMAAFAGIHQATMPQTRVGDGEPHDAAALWRVH